MLLNIIAMLSKQLRVLVIIERNWLTTCACGQQVPVARAYGSEPRRTEGAYGRRLWQRVLADAWLDRASF